MAENGSYVRMDLGGDPPRYKYGQLVQDPFKNNEALWYLKSDAEGGGHGYTPLTRERLANLTELTEQDYFLLMLKKPMSER